MAGNPSGRAQYKVACSCGAAMTLDARAFGQPRPCRSCGATVTVAWGRDPKTYKAVPVAMTRPKDAPATAAPVRGAATAFCGCGYNRPVPPSEKNPSLRCPRCGNLMAVQQNVPSSGKKPQGQSKISAPLLPLHVRSTLQTVVKKGAPTFNCECGMRILIRAGMEGTRIQCPQCDRFHVLEIKAPTEAPPPRQAARAPAPAPAPIVKPRPLDPVPSRTLGLGEFLCQCGEIQPPRTSRTGREFVCKKCGRKGHVETDRDPETGLPKMRAVFTSGPAAPPAPPAPPKPAAAAPAPESVSYEELDPVEAPTAEAADAPPPVDADAQIVPCGCGAEILLSAADVGHTIQCPACTDTMVVEGTMNVHTGATILSLRVVGGLDDPDWKLEEFQ